MAKNVKHQGKRPSESQTPNRINKNVIQDPKSEEIIGKKMFIANMYRERVAEIWINFPKWWRNIWIFKR